MLQVASKLCENKEKVIGALFPDEMLMQQMRAAIKEAVRVLGRVDRDYPGMVPVPHDGKTWKERLFNEDN